jgi:thiamine biosynthesis lipoprotein
MSPRERSHPRPVARLEHRHRFACFGGQCTVLIADSRRVAEAAAAAVKAKRTLLEWHERFSRFEARSELSALNRDPGQTVAVSPMLARLVRAAVDASRLTAGLVDATLGGAIERAGYASSLNTEGTPLRSALALAPARAPAAPDPAQRWQRVSIDAARGTVTRPPGTIIDLGGIAKGVFADELARPLSGFEAFVVECAGDLRLGGRGRLVREVNVADPFGCEPLHRFALTGVAVATSGIGRRSWLTADGRPAHHLLDPSTGRPAFTGVVQATAIAPTGTEAETLAKAAVLAGGAEAPSWLPHGGVVVRDDGSYDVLEPAVSRSAAEDAGARAPSQARMSASTASRSGSLRISW